MRLFRIEVFIIIIIGEDARNQTNIVQPRVTSNHNMYIYLHLYIIFYIRDSVTVARVNTSSGGAGFLRQNAKLKSTKHRDEHAVVLKKKPPQ